MWPANWLHCYPIISSVYPLVSQPISIVYTHWLKSNQQSMPVSQLVYYGAIGSSLPKGMFARWLSCWKTHQGVLLYQQTWLNRKQLSVGRGWGYWWICSWGYAWRRYWPRFNANEQGWRHNELCWGSICIVMESVAVEAAVMESEDRNALALIAVMKSKDWNATTTNLAEAWWLQWLVKQQI